MANTVTPDAISVIFANPSPSSSSNLPEIIVQVLELKPAGNKYMFKASDGKSTVNALLQSALSSEVTSGKIQNLGLIRVLDYSLNEIPSKNETYMIITKCESVSPALEAEYKAQVKAVDSGISLKRKAMDVDDVKAESNGNVLRQKQEVKTKSAAQIIHDQHGNMAPSARMAVTRRVHPLVSLNPYQGNWTIKVRVTDKGNMRTYKNAKGEGCVFNVELTDEDGTQIKTTMFNDAARKFYDKFETGKVYYISKGTLRQANKQFNTVQNDYEMTLNENSEVEEVSSEAAFIPETKFAFTPINELSPYVNGRQLVDIIGVVQSVSPTMSIRRKSNNEIVPKRDIVIADDTKKTVVVSLWNELATNIGQELLDMADKSPVVAIKSLKVVEFQGVSLSALSKSVIVVDPDTPEAKKLRSWFHSEGKDISLDAMGSGITPFNINGGGSMYSNRVSLSHITSNPSLGEEKGTYCSIKAYTDFIKPDQAMAYHACNKCNRKVTEGMGSGYWCEVCSESQDSYRLRYNVTLRVCNESGKAYVTLFDKQAEKVIGSSAEELNDMKYTDDNSDYQVKLKKATLNPYLFRVKVFMNEYNNEKRLKITVMEVAPIDYATESKFLLEELFK